MLDTLSLNAYLMIIVFIIGYILITFEHYTSINKATIALMMAVICWVLQFINPSFSKASNLDFFGVHLSNISQVVFFLLAALTIVEIINVHQGFDIITDFIHTQSKRKLLWIVGVITFFLSAVLDNLTTTVVMLTLVQKLIEKGEDRLIIGGGIVIAANAGGAWTPIGDVTTTMLWIGGQLTTVSIIKTLFIPSVVCMVAAFIFLSFTLSGSFEEKIVHLDSKPSQPLGRFVFYLGTGLLIFVPIFKIWTGLPPFMGMLFGLSAMWLITDTIHCKYTDREHLRVPYVLSRVDLSGTLFFLGVLLCVGALDTGKILEALSMYLNRTIGDTTVIATGIGLFSAVIDNVPLVAATMGMYDLSQFPQNHSLWQLIAYCAGTGGSILLIGSAAGIVFMGIENVNFFWYCKKISIPALVGYFAGIFAYLLLCNFCF